MNQKGKIFFIKDGVIQGFGKKASQDAKLLGMEAQKAQNKLLAP
tara:strand:+ start:1343 stop:1474 length:132 start_codon:yes stop_codon:yes gene_type:complete